MTAWEVSSSSSSLFYGMVFFFRTCPFVVERDLDIKKLHIMMNRRSAGRVSLYTHVQYSQPRGGVESGGKCAVVLLCYFVMLLCYAVTLLCCYASYPVTPLAAKAVS